MTKSLFFSVALTLLVYGHIASATGAMHGGVNKNSFYLLPKFGTVKAASGSIAATDTPTLIKKILRTLADPRNLTKKAKGLIRIYIVDSLKLNADIRKLMLDTAKKKDQIAQLQKRLDTVNCNAIELLKAQVGADTMKVHKLIEDLKAKKSIIALVKAAAEESEFEIAPDILPEPDRKAMDAKLNTIQSLYRGPIHNIKTDTISNGRLVKRTTTTVGYKMQILGFYTDNYAGQLWNYNLRQFTALVYNINPIDGNKAFQTNLDRQNTLFKKAAAEGCRVVLSIYNNQPANVLQILNDKRKSKKFADEVIKLSSSVSAKGINISFKGLTVSSRGPLNSFVSILHDKCEKSGENIAVSITVPAAEYAAYDLSALEKMTGNFIIDFSSATSAPGALAPLFNGSVNSVDTRISAYLNLGIPPKKIILCLPYHGIRWDVNSKKAPHVIPYSDIRHIFADSVEVYKKGESAAHLQIDEGLHSGFDVWYDDEKTLGEKFDYALDAGLGGIAVKYLGEELPALNRHLQYKFLQVNTVVDTVRNSKYKPAAAKNLVNFFRLLFVSPNEHRDEFDVYLPGLTVVNVCLAAFLVVGFIFLTYMTVKKGDIWIGKQVLSWILIVMLGMWSVVALMNLFFWRKFALFGASVAKIHNTPFIVLFGVLFLGTLVGMAVRWMYQVNNNHLNR